MSMSYINETHCLTRLYSALSVQETRGKFDDYI